MSNSNSIRSRDEEPLLADSRDTERAVEASTSSSSTSLLQTYRKSATMGASAFTVQVFGLIFVALVWGLVFSRMPLTLLPLFGYHPIVQSLALLLLLQSIMTLQPTTSSRASEKKAAFKVHQILNLLLVLPLFTIGVAIMWYLHDQPGSKHFISWHGIIGFSILIWPWFQVAIGVAMTSFDGKLLGGQGRAKSMYKWHRLSGYILLPSFLFTVYLGATQTSWSQQNASQKHHIGIAICLIGVTAAMAVRIQRSKLPV